MPRPVIYLDSQDFSRFGDVLRGKADKTTEQLFKTLEAQVASGDAIFAVSGPILSELLQYDANFRDTTLHKAQAVERLCGKWALADPSRLVAFEISQMAQQFGELPKDESLAILSDERRWYPNVTGPFRNLRAQFDRGVREKIESLGLANRTSRRAAKRIVAKFDPAKAAAQAAPEMAMIFGLPENVFICSLVALLKGAITPEQASRRLFEAIAEPVAFVSIYFEKIETDRLLPEWISGLSRKLDTRITEFRDALLPSINAPNERIHLEKLLGEWPEELRTMALRIANENDLAEFGISVELRDRLLQSPPFAASVPAAKTLSAIIPQYIRQILGFLGSQSSIERSFGGDIIHALYLPHVDLWRGDRRFSNIVQNVLPELKDSVIPTLKELPSAIDNWNEKHLHDMPR